MVWEFFSAPGFFTFNVVGDDSSRSFNTYGPNEAVNVKVLSVLASRS